jgi:Amt family ammonium transporter
MNEQLQLLTTAANIPWLLLAGFLVFFMQVGFALVETCFICAKNISHSMLMDMMVFCIGAIGYWIYGFAYEQTRQNVFISIVCG